MRKIILSLSAALLASIPVWAINCQVETDCTTLGYTIDSDAGGCLKCPFGNKWACSTSGGVSKDCVVGAILNSDMSCSEDVVSGKTPIGVVFESEKRLAIGLNTSKLDWVAVSQDLCDIPNLTNYDSILVALEDWNGKENTKIILDYCQANGKSCPAAEYAASYSTEGTKAGDWYLPALAELKAIGEITYILDTSLSKIGGTLLPNTPQWSSTEKSSTGAWGSYFEDNMSSYGKVSCFFCSSCAGFLR